LDFKKNQTQYLLPETFCVKRAEEGKPSYRYIIVLGVFPVSFIVLMCVPGK